ncbi:hypothetical protein BN7_4917 [Wickerhamomyces ciferrii]|uniref:Uncharacterized protein n=1 Tax=Wickerhamomyces ciferrii (strain ATCC 14091 / BCRC 22168 / CBS 111 / JCM 3599 / NBRC 0793 / NRRL Y-1031 F-60-10) TaxID=1206466 RepID=K0KJC7_WICCF|nr:uncharacterized protein BN7_4917 [Wickerhamomyces ciferrii]CCH45335.1 hypothetical protein BN7_4917 [Wickerhamomyces ciferrii]
MSQRERIVIPTKPLSAPIQSPLTATTKEKRIPSQLYHLSSKDSTNTSPPSSSASGINNHQKDIPKHRRLPEINTARLSNVPSFKITPVGDSYRHIKSASHDEKSNDKKRLVDQFYDQYGTPPPSAPGTRTQTPSLTRNNTSTSIPSYNQSRTNLAVLNKYEYEPKNLNHGDGPTSKIGEMINEIEQVIVKKVKEQVEVNEEEFSNKIDDFQYIINEIKIVKDRINLIIHEIQNEKLNQFNDNFQSFQTDIEKFMNFLIILENYEEKLFKSRDRMNLYKRKLLDIRKTIELGEKLKIMEYEKSENRTKWIIAAGFFGLILLVYMKLFKS